MDHSNSISLKSGLHHELRLREGLHFRLRPAGGRLLQNEPPVGHLYRGDSGDDEVDAGWRRHGRTERSDNLRLAFPCGVGHQGDDPLGAEGQVLALAEAAHLLAGQCVVSEIAPL